MLINSTVHYSVKIWISQYQNGKQSRILIQQEMVEVVDWWWCKLEVCKGPVRSPATRIPAVSCPFCQPSNNQSINKFITRHSTEACATMSLSQTEKECLKSVLENVNEWSSPTAQWKRVPESWCHDRETVDDDR